MPRAVVGLMCALSVGVACTSPAGETQSSPTPSASPSASSPTPTDTGSPLLLGDVLFEDDFSDASSGWPDVPAGKLVPGLTVGYEAGQYVMSAAPGAKLAYMLPAPATRSANHVVVSADVAHFGNHALYGLFCKSDERTANAYVFAVDSTGTWAVAQMSPGGLIAIDGGQSDAIEPGIAANRLDAYCFDQQPLPAAVAELQFYVNGEQLFEGQVPNGLAGRKNSLPGLFFETDFEGDTEVVFDDFLFTGVDPDLLSS